MYRTYQKGTVGSNSWSISSKWYINKHNHLSVALVCLTSNRSWCIIQILLIIKMGYCSWHCLRKPLSTGSAPRILRLGCMLESPDGFRNPKAQVMVQNCIKVSEAGLESSVVYKVPQVISKVKLVLRTTGTIIPIL